MKTKKRENNDNPLVTELEEIKSLLQDLLIFQSLQAGIPTHAVREMVKVSLNRVSHISKVIGKAKNENRG